MNILYLGDIFGQKAITMLAKHLPKLKSKLKIDFVIAQGENVSGRKGLVPADYHNLMQTGIDVFTMGNHVWAKEDIKSIINNNNIVRPLNVKKVYPGKGSAVFKIKGQTIRVSQFMGIAFNDLRSPWKETQATNFFDAFDRLDNQADIHIIDFHGETTSEKNVFGLYLDGKVDAFIGTHTHVQTNDARILPRGTAFITDVGMVGPINSAIGASFESVYRKMRFDEKSKFTTATTAIMLNAVIISINKNGRKISTINKVLR